MNLQDVKKNDELDFHDLLNFYHQKAARYSAVIEFLLFIKSLSLLIFILIQVTLFVTKVELPKLAFISYVFLIIFIFSYIVQLLVEHYFAILERKIALSSNKQNLS
ncbi:MAG: hypothetical protein PWP03_765 [Candidatus Woesearchaeota archaeon]|nr:hypothetical protein [Candidatus Woesearchaeota archaeon]MDN5328127.1 hypothetical protein [Candidatus Woesearchaeota archaeon]